MWHSFQVTRKRYYKDFTIKSLWEKWLYVRLPSHSRKQQHWSEQGKEEILNKAVEKYLQKKQETKIVDATKDSELKSNTDQSENNNSSSVSSSSDECSDMEVYSQ